jgi:hypothetical protein
MEDSDGYFRIEVKMGPSRGQARANFKFSDGQSRPGQ